MSLSTEQMTKLAKHCGWRQEYVLHRDYYQDAPGAARGSYTQAVARDNTPDFTCALDFTLTLAGERIVIETFLWTVTYASTAKAWRIYSGKKVSQSPNLSQAIEAAVKARLEAQTGDKNE